MSHGIFVGQRFRSYDESSCYCCADNPFAIAHTSADVQKLLELEEEWGFNVIDLELLTKRR